MKPRFPDSVTLFPLHPSFLVKIIIKNLSVSLVWNNGFILAKTAFPDYPFIIRCKGQFSETINPNHRCVVESFSSNHNRALKTISVGHLTLLVCIRLVVLLKHSEAYATYSHSDADPRFLLICTCECGCKWCIWESTAARQIQKSGVGICVWDLLLQKPQLRAENLMNF